MIAHEPRPRVQTLIFNDEDVKRTIAQSVFVCQRCGSCCKTINRVSVKPTEVSRLARKMRLPPSRFVRRYLVEDPDPDYRGMYMLRHREADGMCRLYNSRAKGCRVYEVRPAVCRAFPFLAQLHMMSDQFYGFGDCPGCMEAIEHLQDPAVPMETSLGQYYLKLVEAFGRNATEVIKRIGELAYLQNVVGQDITPYVDESLYPAFGLMIEYARYQTGVTILAKEGGRWVLSL